MKRQKKKLVLKKPKLSERAKNLIFTLIDSGIELNQGDYIRCSDSFGENSCTALYYKERTELYKEIEQYLKELGNESPSSRS